MSAAVDPASLIREARKRAEKATPGPWDGDIWDFNVWTIRGPHGAEVVADYVDKPNATFIAAARSDVPALCDLAEEQAREIERLTKTGSVWESERRRIEAALDTGGLHDAEYTLTSRVERTCAEVAKGRQIERQLQACLDLYEDDFDTFRGARSRPLVRIQKLADERDKLKAEIVRMRPIVEAALTWHEWAADADEPEIDSIEPLKNALCEACEAYRPMIPKLPTGER